MANNAWSQSTLGKDGNGLLTDQAKGGYYEAKITWWLFRNQITPMIDASFGLLAGVDGASYTDFMYINPKNSNVTEYKSVIAGMAGIQAAVSLRLSEKWILQPSFVTYYDFGKQIRKLFPHEFLYRDILLLPHPNEINANRPPADIDLSLAAGDFPGKHLTARSVKNHHSSRYPRICYADIEVVGCRRWKDLYIQIINGKIEC